MIRTTKYQLTILLNLQKKADSLKRITLPIQHFVVIHQKLGWSRFGEIFLTAVFKHLKHNMLLCSQFPTLIQMNGSEKEVLKDTQFFAFGHFRHYQLIYGLKLRIEYFTNIAKINHNNVIFIG